jgi:hypothetical protein
MKLWSGLNRRALSAELRAAADEGRKEMSAKLAAALLYDPVSPGKFSLSFDEWTARDGTSWVAVSVSVTGNDGLYQHYQWGTVQVSSTGLATTTKHIATSITAAELEKIIRNMFSAPLVGGKPLFDFVLGMTTDGASTPLLAVRSMAVDNGWHCICHVIHLLVAVDMGLQKRKKKGVDALNQGDDDEEGNEMVENLTVRAYLANVKLVVNKLARSSVAKRKFDAKWISMYPDDTMPLRPIVEAATRWSSTYFLLLRFMEIWPVIVRLSYDAIGFPATEWVALKLRIADALPTLRQLVVLLQVPFQLTERFSANGLPKFLKF